MRRKTKKGPYSKPMPSIFRDESGREMARRQEKRVIVDAMGDRLTPGSGSAGIKGDGQGKTRKIECKTTSKSQITIKRLWLEKLYEEALLDGREPVLVFGFEGPVKAGFPRDWAAVPLERLVELMDLEERVSGGEV